MKVFQTVSTLAVLSALPCYAQTSTSSSCVDTMTGTHYAGPCEDNVESPEINNAPSSKLVPMISKSKVLEFGLSTYIIFDAVP
jgi:hypothetical protein